MKEIDTLLSHIGNFEAHKPVHTEYATIQFKKSKEKFSATHRDELDTATLNRLVKEIVAQHIDSNKTRYISIEIHFNLKPILEVEQVTA